MSVIYKATSRLQKVWTGHIIPPLPLLAFDHADPYCFTTRTLDKISRITCGTKLRKHKNMHNVF